MSAFGGLGDIQIETILPREGGEEILVGGFSYARFIPKADLHMLANCCGSEGSIERAEVEPARYSLAI